MSNMKPNFRDCRHKIEAHKYVQRICTAATNEPVFLAYLVAIPRHCFRWRKAFSTRYLALYSTRSCSRGSLRLRLEGMTGSIPLARATSINALVSYPLSANRYAASKPSIKGIACVQSAVVPDVIMHFIGIPCPSTAKWILLFSPPW